MSRCTQYVGLTDAASEYLRTGGEAKNNLTLLEYKYTDKDPYFEKRSVAGMMDERIPLGTWRRNFKGRDVFIREVVQCTPWAGGPMIFTCLEIDLGNGEHWEEPGDLKYDGTSAIMCFQWIDDPTVECEIDKATGRMWV